MDASQNCYNEDTTHLTAKLDQAEREVFQQGQKALDQFVDWETGQTEKITTSEMVLNHRKRKRAQMEEFASASAT